MVNSIQRSHHDSSQGCDKNLGVRMLILTEEVDDVTATATKLSEYKPAWKLVSARMYVCRYVCTYEWMYVSVYVCMYVCMYVSMYLCVYIYIHTHTHT